MTSQWLHKYCMQSRTDPPAMHCGMVMPCSLFGQAYSCDPYMDIKDACSYNAQSICTVLLSHYSVSDVFIISICSIVSTGCIHAYYISLAI